MGVGALALGIHVLRQLQSRAGERQPEPPSQEAQQVGALRLGGVERSGGARARNGGEGRAAVAGLASRSMRRRPAAAAGR